MFQGCKNKIKFGSANSAGIETDEFDPEDEVYVNIEHQLYMQENGKFYVVPKDKLIKNGKLKDYSGYGFEVFTPKKSF